MIAATDRHVPVHSPRLPNINVVIIMKKGNTSTVSSYRPLPLNIIRQITTNIEIFRIRPAYQEYWVWFKKKPIREKPVNANKKVASRYRLLNKFTIPMISEPAIAASSM